MSNTNIYDRLSAYHGKGVYPFHMPGHKRNKQYLDGGLLDCDITEIPGMDNLHHAEGMILRAQTRAARMYGADQSFFLVNGATGGLTAAILAAVRDGETALVARNCHRSVYSGLALAGARPRYILPDLTAYGFPGGVSPAAVAEVLDRDDTIVAVIITSPTYEGCVSDIAAIAEITHQKNKLLIVDEAHGAHFAFSPFFPKSAVRCGADIVVQSLHKTLPALTQTAILHVNHSRVNIPRLKAALAITQTSSPSYMMLAQADRCLEMLAADPAIMDAYSALLSGFREAAGESTAPFRLIGRELIGKSSVYDIDCGKLVFYINSDDMNGPQAEQALCRRHGVQIEMSGARHILAMTSPADTAEGFQRLMNGIRALSGGLEPAAKSPTAVNRPEIPTLAIPPREAVLGRFKRMSVPLSESAGKISADFVIPYPPGIPLIAPGEAFNERLLDQIDCCIKNNIPLLGQNITKKGLIDILIPEG